jgi:hypothetical protein
VAARTFVASLCRARRYRSTSIRWFNR